MYLRKMYVVKNVNKKIDGKLSGIIYLGIVGTNVVLMMNEISRAGKYVIEVVQQM
jgi:hypothetical protein